MGNDENNQFDVFAIQEDKEDWGSDNKANEKSGSGFTICAQSAFVDSHVAADHA